MFDASALGSVNNLYSLFSECKQNHCVGFTVVPVVAILTALMQLVLFHKLSAYYWLQMNRRSQMAQGKA